MATKQQVMDLHRENPDWSAPDIAARLGCKAAYVRATAQRCGLDLPKGKAVTVVETPPPADWPTGQYGTIFADPPWAFRTFGGDNATPHRSAEDHYSTMSLQQLRALPVADIAAKDAALFMWVVDSHLDEALALGRAWGFEFKTIAFVWAKTVQIPKQVTLFGEMTDFRIGMGYWTRKQVEVCLLFTRGRPKRLAKDVRQIIAAPRREHSRKPDEIHDRVQRLVGGPYLELFARAPRAGWTVWGNQTDKFAEAA